MVLLAPIIHTIVLLETLIKACLFLFSGLLAIGKGIANGTFITAILSTEIPSFATIAQTLFRITASMIGAPFHGFFAVAWPVQRKEGEEKEYQRIEFDTELASIIGMELVRLPFIVMRDLLLVALGATWQYIIQPLLLMMLQATIEHIIKPMLQKTLRFTHQRVLRPALLLTLRVTYNNIIKPIFVVALLATIRLLKYRAQRLADAQKVDDNSAATNDDSLEDDKYLTLITEMLDRLSLEDGKDIKNETEVSAVASSNPNATLRLTNLFNFVPGWKGFTGWLVGGLQSN